MSTAAWLGLGLLAVVWDLVVGEPPNRWHPVVWIGRAIRVGERWRRQHPLDVLRGGLLLVGLTGAAAVLGYGLMRGLVALSPWATLALVPIISSMFAIRMLGEAAIEVANALDAENIGYARERLRWLCSRDPSGLSADELVSGATSSVAENLTDSVTAPLFWFAVAGLPGLFVYRVTNTLDAMIGYRDHNEWFGKPAAYFDDVLNWLPARLTALGLCVVTALSSPAAGRRSLRTWRRDAHLTPSPNGGHTMAAMAGALGVALSKPKVYTLGDPIRPLTAKTIRESWRLAFRAGALTTAVAFGSALAASYI